MTRSFPPRSALRDFLESESAGGMLLIFAAILAMIVANSAFAETYEHAIHAVTGPTLTDKLGPMTVHSWINDGLMAVFFLLVGLEIKRERSEEHTSELQSLMRISYAVFCLKKKKNIKQKNKNQKEQHVSDKQKKRVKMTLKK